MHRVSVCVMRSYIYAKSFLICRAVVAFKYLVAKLLLFGKMISLFYNNNFTASLLDYLFSLSFSYSLSQCRICDFTSASIFNETINADAILINGFSLLIEYIYMHIYIYK